MKNAIDITDLFVYERVSASGNCIYPDGTIGATFHNCLLSRDIPSLGLEKGDIIRSINLNKNHLFFYPDETLKSIGSIQVELSLVIKGVG